MQYQGYLQFEMSLSMPVFSKHTYHVYVIIDVIIYRCYPNRNITCPDWCGSVAWASFRKAKGHRFSFRSGHMPGLWVQSRFGVCESQPTNVSLSHWSFSPSLSLSPPHSLNINKWNLKKRKETSPITPRFLLKHPFARHTIRPLPTLCVKSTLSLEEK